MQSICRLINDYHQEKTFFLCVHKGVAKGKFRAARVRITQYVFNDDDCREKCLTRKKLEDIHTVQTVLYGFWVIQNDLAMY